MTDEDDSTRSGTKESRFLALAKKRFKLAEEADHDQRERELADLQFYAGDQWPEANRRAREGQQANNGMPAVPARPCLVINKVREPVRQVLNSERQSDMGLEITAADDFGELGITPDDTEIKLREGLVRRIQRSAEAADGRSWAFSRATIAGRGFYGVMTKFAPGPTWDQDIYIHRFYNQSSVSLDPAHEQPDGSDAEWAFVGTDMPWDAYKAEFPSTRAKFNRVSSDTTGKDDFRALGEEAPEWFTTTGETRMCRVVDYYYTVRETRKLAQLEDGSVAWHDELPAGATVTDTREVIEKKIKWAKIDGVQVLDETDWPGPDLPIVKVLGEELHPHDGKRRSEGMVRPSRDSQVGFNAMISKWVESVALSPIPPWMIAEGQIDGYQPWYDAAATRTLPYLYYRTKDLEGNVVGPPQRTPMDTNISAIAASVQMFDEGIKSTTGVPSSTLGEHTDASLKSGRAIKALQDQAEHGTSNYLDNMARSMRYEGQIINNLLYAIYNRPGRIAKIINGAGETETVLLHQPMVQGQGPGARPQPAPMGADGQPMDPNAKKYTLTKDAQFNVNIKVTKAYNTRREQEAAIVGDLLSAAPQLMTWFGDLFFKNQDGPGHDEMADRAKVMLDPKIQQMMASKQQGLQNPLPPEVQQQLAQIPQMQQALQAAQQQIQTDQAKQQASIQIKQMDLQFQQWKVQQDNETKIAVAELGAKVDRLALFLEERARLGSEMHEAGMAQMGHQQALESQSQQAQTAQESQSADQQHQAAMQEAAAQQQPEVPA